MAGQAGRDLAQPGGFSRGQVLYLSEQGGDRVGGGDRGAQTGGQESLSYEVREQALDRGGRRGGESGGERFGENGPHDRRPRAVHGHTDRPGRTYRHVRGGAVVRGA